MVSFLKKSLFPFSFLIALIFFVPQQQFAFTKPLRFLPRYVFQNACGIPGIGRARCHVQVVTDKNGTPLAAPIPPSTAFGPVQFHSAYQLPCTPGGSVQSNCIAPSTFGPTIAIVDAYNDPTVENDLNVYSSAYGLPSCTVANGCLQVVNQNGGLSLPATDSGWALEISLDVQIAHATCQTCKILLVEANSASITDLGTAVNTAANLGAKAISNSYGGKEFSGEINYDSYYNHPGIAVTASAGDSGYGTEFPASSPHVVAVGGTTLNLFTDNTYASESVWSGTGSGCSKYESAALWQTSLSNWNLTGCSTSRGVTDVAADADPNTGAGVYDSTPYSGQSGWWIVGGTSLSSPLIASSYILAGGVPSSINAGSVLYNNFLPGAFHDITAGSNGTCTTIMCIGATGYDGPTGLGSPNGLLAFGGSTSATPTPTGTPTPTPTPTSAPTPTPTPTPISSLTVTITNPLNGSLVRHWSTVTIAASVLDSVPVTKVEFYINGSLKATQTTSPYLYNWFVPGSKNKQYILTAKAYDITNATATNSVTVTSY